MHALKSIRLRLLAALAIVTLASRAVAAPRCEKPCKAETPACIGERCAGLSGDAKRTCVKAYRGSRLRGDPDPRLHLERVPVRRARHHGPPGAEYAARQLRAGDSPNDRTGRADP